MKLNFKMVMIFLVSFLSSSAFCGLTLKVKIGTLVNNKLVEVTRSVSSDFEKEILIEDESFKDKIVLTLKKIKNVLANGTKIEPIQISIQTFDPTNKSNTRSHTITSFYSKEANFKIASIQENQKEILFNLQFNEVN
jgi:hypothetical protein